MYNDLEQVCVGCEGIMCAERFEAYKFMTAFLVKNTPRRPIESVNVVAGDGFFNQEMVNDLGFTNANFMTDQFDLFDSVLPDRFGKYYPHLKPHLQQMANALSKEKFEHAVKMGTNILQQITPRNAEVESKFHSFSEQRKTYAQYILREMKGTRGRRGSCPSEQNHSGILCHLNDGERSQNKYCEAPITLIRDLFDQQKYHINSTKMVVHSRPEV